MKKRIRFILRAMKSRFIRDVGEIASLRKSLNKGDVAIDIGANKGQYTFWMLQSVGRDGKVIAFEPQPVLAKYLEDIKASMSYSQLTVENCGLSKEPARLTLVIPQAGKSQSPLASFEAAPREDFTSYEVDVDTLDRYCSARPEIRPLRFIKCDVEGHEFSVISGGINTLKEDHPDILFECETRHLKGHNIKDIFDLLESIGYTGSFIQGGKLRPIGEFDPSVHQVYGQKPYSNNFLFKHSKRA